MNISWRYVYLLLIVLSTIAISYSFRSRYDHFDRHAGEIRRLIQSYFQQPDYKSVARIVAIASLLSNKTVQSQMGQSGMMAYKQEILSSGICQRYFVTVFFNCPERAGNFMIPLINTFIWGLLTNTTVIVNSLAPLSGSSNACTLLYEPKVSFVSHTHFDLIQKFILPHCPRSSGHNRVLPKYRKYNIYDFRDFNISSSQSVDILFQRGPRCAYGAMFHSLLDFIPIVSCGLTVRGVLDEWLKNMKLS